jgi:hypothetical protein
VKIELSKTLKNTVVFSCTLNNNTSDYGFLLNKNTKFVVILDDGTVQEYDMFGDRLKYYEMSNRIYSGKSGKLLPLEIYNVDDINMIKHIKITNVSFWKNNINNNKPQGNYELQLYKK